MYTYTHTYIYIYTYTHRNRCFDIRTESNRNRYINVCVNTHVRTHIHANKRSEIVIRCCMTIRTLQTFHPSCAPFSSPLANFITIYLFNRFYFFLFFLLLSFFFFFFFYFIRFLRAEKAYKDGLYYNPNNPFLLQSWAVMLEKIGKTPEVMMCCNMQCCVMLCCALSSCLVLCCIALCCAVLYSRVELNSVEFMT